MTASVGVDRVDALVRERLPDERDVHEQEHEGGQSEQDGSGGPTPARTHQSDRQKNREHDPRRRYPFDDPRGDGEGQTQKRERNQQPFPGEHVTHLADRSSGSVSAHARGADQTRSSGAIAG